MQVRKVTLATNPAKLGRAETVRISMLVFRWCKNNIGVNKRKMYDVEFAFTKGDPYECGEYEPEDNKITIFWNSLESMEELIRTCIHEWIHYRQPILTQYFKYKGPYSKHPFEKQARKAEDEHYQACWDAIKDKVNKHKK